MLVETRTRQTGIRIPGATLRRALTLIQARRGRPRPTVRCPWSPAAQARRQGASRWLRATRPRQPVAVYEDEMDIPWNPKIGLDGMVRGQPKEVRTPRTNAKQPQGEVDRARGETFMPTLPATTRVEP
ncbi:MAG TPA: hypothetical protein VNK04_15620 [Gemmataceae bacterium]|nr:hypothetical protein [Gemmataceae bacterium]